MAQFYSSGLAQAFDIVTFLKNLNKYNSEVFDQFIMVVGGICIAVSVVLLAKYFSKSAEEQGGRDKSKLIWGIGLFLFGGLCAFGGYEWFKKASKSGLDTMNKLGDDSTILIPMVAYCKVGLANAIPALSGVLF